MLFTLYHYFQTEENIIDLNTSHEIFELSTTRQIERFEKTGYKEMCRFRRKTPIVKART